MLNDKKQQNKLNWFVWATVLGLLYYLPYYVKNMLNSDTAQLNHELLPIKGEIKNWLLFQARPLASIDNFLYMTFSFELLTILGVLGFIFATIKFVELVLPSLSNLLKLLVFLLLFVNPFLYFERGWPYQFFMQSINTTLYYISFWFILKYKEKPFNLVKLFFAYLFPIGSLVIGLNYFMPSFFHFVVLCMVMVLKRHIENPFKTIAQVLNYAKDFLIIVLLGSIIYIAEISFGWYLLDYNLVNYRKNAVIGRGSNLNLTERLLNLSNMYNLFFNYVGLIFTAILLLSRRNIISIFLFLMICLVYVSPYFFYVILNMNSTSILQFPNYYLTFFVAGLLLVKHQAILKVKLVKTLATLAILFLIYFYCSSYYFYFVQYQQQKKMENLAHDINNYVIKTYHTNNSYLIKLISYYNMKRINSSLPETRMFFFNVIRPDYALAFGGVWLGIPHIRAYTGRSKMRDKAMGYIKDVYLRDKCLELVKATKIFPHPESVFLYKGIYYVIN